MIVRFRPASLLLATALLVPACGTTSRLFASGYATVPATPDAASLESAMLSLVNRDRAAAGLSPLLADPGLADVARAHAADMVEHRFFDHVSPNSGTIDDRLDRAGRACLEARENLATATSADEAEANLRASPGHRANLLAPRATRVGIGVVRGDPNGPRDDRMYTFTQVFARPAELPPLAASREEVARSLAALRQGGAALDEPAWLVSVASDEVRALSPAFGQSELAGVGKAAVAAVAAHAESGLRRVELDAQTVLALEQYAPPDMAGAPDARALGWSIASDRDERGRPVAKILVLVAR